VCVGTPTVVALLCCLSELLECAARLLVVALSAVQQSTVGVAQLAWLRVVAGCLCECKVEHVQCSWFV
jgi:hypothetical protein